MIDSIRIKNIQSHKDTELDFCPGINVIVGSSNNGKTAILRSLYWSIYNRPLGIDNLCSHWALDEKGNIKEEMSVEVKKGSDTLIRRKTKNINQYVLNGVELNAIKTDVPIEVKNFYRMNETNIQRQQDAPFLVSSSSGEVAKYFNGIAKLDVIDNVLSYTEQVKRKQKNNIESLEKRIDEQKELHSSFSWIEGASELFDKLDRLSSKETTLNDAIDNIARTIERHDSYESEIETFSTVNTCINYMDDLDDIEKKQDILNGECTVLSTALDKFDYLTDILDRSESLPIELMNRYDKLVDSMRDLNDIIKKMDNSISVFENYMRTIDDNNKKIEKWESELPDICPLCGNPMKEGEHDC